MKDNKKDTKSSAPIQWMLASNLVWICMNTNTPVWQSLAISFLAAAAINESCFFNEQCEAVYFQAECRDGRCICRFEMSPIWAKDGSVECKGRYRLSPSTWQLSIVYLLLLLFAVHKQCNGKCVCVYVFTCRAAGQARTRDLHWSGHDWRAGRHGIDVYYYLCRPAIV